MMAMGPFAIRSENPIIMLQLLLQREILVSRQFIIDVKFKNQLLYKIPP